MADKFDKAVKIVGGLPKDGPVQPSADDKLQFYANYKQATIGDVNIDRPGMLDFTGKAKWDAWKAREGTTTEVAKKTYVEKLIAILEQNPDNEDAKKHLAELK